VTGPPVSLVRATDTHRLIPSKYSQANASVLTRLAANEADLAGLFDLDHATNDRLLAENGLLPGIGVHELLFGVPCSRIVNAAFCHAHPLGSRFNGPDRGAWYAGLELETAQAEVAFHKAVEYAEIGQFDDSVTYDDYLSDVSAELHDLRLDPDRAPCLDPDSYIESQGLAERLLADGGLGIIYPSVRHADGTCIAIFRPALVMNVRKGPTWRFTWAGSPAPVIARA
jgi:RES domain-containing protein